MAGFTRIASLMKGSPVLIASVQAGGLMSLGDGISQTFVERKEKFDLNRNIRFGMLGLCVIVSVCYHNRRQSKIRLDFGVTSDNAFLYAYYYRAQPYALGMASLTSASMLNHQNCGQQWRKWPWIKGYLLQFSLPIFSGSIV